MANNETCIHGGVSPSGLLYNLPDSQAGSGRHRCPTCAFEQGFNSGSKFSGINYAAYCKSLVGSESCKHGSIAPTKTLLNLGENQGGPGRHKCTICAFKDGFNLGLKNSNQSIFTFKEVNPPQEAILEKNTIPIVRKIDFIEEEIKNKHLGNLGELLVLNNEIDFLNNQGFPDLAKKVKHVSVEQGDGAGYDILSFNIDGSEKLIEVKTTRADIKRPFYLSRNEINTSIKNPGSYFLHRVFDFDINLNKANFYVIKGNLQENLNLEPLVFSALPLRSLD